MLKNSLISVAVVGIGASFALAAISGFPQSNLKTKTTSTSVAAIRLQDEDDEKDEAKSVKMGDLPEGAKAAIKKAAGKHELKRVKSEEELGSKVFEAAWNVDELEHEIVVMADETILAHEEVLEIADAPQAVQALVSKKFSGKAKVIVDKKTIVLHSIEATIDGNENEILVTGAGREVNVEADDEAEAHEQKSGTDDDDDNDHHAGKHDIDDHHQAGKNDDDDHEKAKKNKDDDDDDDKT